jgi:hypothetical protein
MTKLVMIIPTPSPPLATAGGFALSDSEKAEALADSLEARSQPVNDPSKPAVIDVVNEAVRAYSFSPASQPKPTNSTEVQDAIRALKVGEVPGPNGTPNENALLINAPAYSSYDGLRVPGLEVRRSLPYQATAGVSVRVPSHCYQCKCTNAHRVI